MRVYGAPFVVAHGKAMGLIPGPLQQAESGRLAGQPERLIQLGRKTTSSSLAMLAQG